MWILAKASNNASRYTIMERRLIIRWILLLTLSQSVMAAVPYGSDAVIDIQFDVGEIVLPNANISGEYASEVQLQAVVNADDAHAIGIGFEGFVKVGDQQDPFVEGVSVRVNNSFTLEPGQEQLVCASDYATPPGGAELPLTLQFKIDDLELFPAGQYQGTVVFVVMALP